jgi:hypothetical protein
VGETVHVCVCARVSVCVPLQEEVYNQEDFLPVNDDGVWGRLVSVSTAFLITASTGDEHRETKQRVHDDWAGIIIGNMKKVMNNINWDYV